MHDYHFGCCFVWIFTDGSLHDSLRCERLDWNTEKKQQQWQRHWQHQQQQRNENSTTSYKSHRLFPDSMAGCCCCCFFFVLLFASNVSSFALSHLNWLSATTFHFFEAAEEASSREIFVVTFDSWNSLSEVMVPYVIASFLQFRCENKNIQQCDALLQTTTTTTATTTTMTMMTITIHSVMMVRATGNKMHQNRLTDWEWVSAS